MPSNAGPWASSHSLLRYRLLWKYAFRDSCSGSMRRPITFACRAASCCGTATRLMAPCKGPGILQRGQLRASGMLQGRITLLHKGQGADRPLPSSSCPITLLNTEYKLQLL